MSHSSISVSMRLVKQFSYSSLSVTCIQ